PLRRPPTPKPSAPAGQEPPSPSLAREERLAPRRRGSGEPRRLDARRERSLSQAAALVVVSDWRGHAAGKGRTSTMTTRALVLSGGGPVGIAWECGLIAGLEAAGVRLAEADFTIGTSAGSFVGARLAMGVEARALADAILAEAARARPATSGSGSGGGRPADTSGLMQMLSGEGVAALSQEEMLKRIGAFALAAETMGEEAFINSFGRSFAGLPADAWPERGFACTAVDAESGEFRLWTADSRVGVTRAVASSCSVPGVYPPVTIDGRRYIDGGM